MSSMSSAFPLLSHSHVDYYTLNEMEFFQQLQGKCKTLGRQKCHTDSVSPSSTIWTVTGHLPLCLGIGASFRGAGAVPSCLTGNWSIPQHIHLQMTRGSMCSGAFSLPLWWKPVYIEVLKSVVRVQKGRRETKRGKASMEGLQTNHKLRRVEETRPSERLVLHLSSEAPRRWGVVTARPRAGLLEASQPDQCWISGSLNNALSKLHIIYTCLHTIAHMWGQMGTQIMMCNVEGY